MSGYESETYHYSRLKGAVVCFVGWPSFDLYRCNVNGYFPFYKIQKIVRGALTPVHSNVLLRVDVPTSKDGGNKSERARKSG